jgi:hypothetical protein
MVLFVYLQVCHPNQKKAAARDKKLAQLRIAASIIFIAVVVPMRWLAGKTHELAHCNWSERSM